jgi:hypothetical protein
VKPPEDHAAGPLEDAGRPGANATAGAATAATESVGLEQCRNCAILLTRDERGVRCAVCGFPHDKKRPSRPDELKEYLGRLRRGDRRAGAEELIDLAERFALQWGSPELKPAPRRLRTRDAGGPALAIQEASGSERYLVVVFGEVPWPSGLVHFFVIEEEAGVPLATRVRLRQEAIAELDGRGNLECESAGKLQVVKRAAAAERAVPTSNPPPIAKPESRAWDLINQYCLIRGSSIVNLGQRAREMGLQIGSPSSIRGQRHVLNGPDCDSRLLAIKNGREERLFVVVGPDATVTEAEWLDLFRSRSFRGVGPVRSTRPATVNAVSGEVEEKGELEVLTAPPANPPPVAKPPVEIPVLPVPPRPVVSRAAMAALLAAVLAILGSVWIARTWGGGGGETPSPTPPGPTSVPVYTPPGVGSLEVRANCPALGNLDGLILPESKKQRSSVLRWTNQSAKTHLLKVTCDGFEDTTRNVSLEEGEHTVLDVTLRRR